VFGGHKFVVGLEIYMPASAKVGVRAEVEVEVGADTLTLSGRVNCVAVEFVGA